MITPWTKRVSKMILDHSICSNCSVFDFVQEEEKKFAQRTSLLSNPLYFSQKEVLQYHRRLFFTQANLSTEETPAFYPDIPHYSSNISISSTSAGNS